MSRGYYGNPSGRYEDIPVGPPPSPERSYPQGPFSQEHRHQSEPGMAYYNRHGFHTSPTTSGAGGDSRNDAPFSLSTIHPLRSSIRSSRSCYPHGSHEEISELCAAIYQLTQLSTGQHRSGSFIGPNLDARRIMPKNFTDPLTCFYWATQGHCHKSDQDCWYAHYHTGIIADAPVKVGSEVAVAGREARFAISAQRTREEILKAREEAIEAREAALAKKTEAIQSSSKNLQYSIENMFTAVANMREEVDANLKVLGAFRQELLKMSDQSYSSRSGSIDYHEFGDRLLSRLDKTGDGIYDLKKYLKAVMDVIGNKIGTPEFPPLPRKEEIFSHDREW